MLGWILVGLGALVVVLFFRQVWTSRASMERLNQPPDDLRRADDNQPPPQDGSAGFI